MQEIKYSVIGTSWITNSFIEGAKLVDGLILDGVYSRSEEKGNAFAQAVGAKRVFKSIEEVADSDTDFVYVASPNSCHYEQCKFLLENMALQPYMPLFSLDVQTVSSKLRLVQSIFAFAHQMLLCSFLVQMHRQIPYIHL